MRAARLLQILLILQNRGRQTAPDLATELEVSRRTILRDVDAMSEAGLPIVVFQGNKGGIELGFNYRTRLTGLARDEAEALGILVSGTNPLIDALGLGEAARRGAAKFIESLPDSVRDTAQLAASRFRIEGTSATEDPRLPALAQAVRRHQIVTLRATTTGAQVIHPTGLTMDQDGWAVQDLLTGSLIGQADWGRVNVSAHRFSPP